MPNIQEVLSPQEIAHYQQQGLSVNDMQNALNNAQSQQSPLQQSYNQAMASRSNNPLSKASHSFVTQGSGDNLIQWQLELDSILERIEHMLRGDKPKWENGSLIWVKATEDKDKIFNEEGVTEIMRILSIYLNRNTILSNYDEPTINWKVYDLGHELADLIYLKYEAMGLGTLEKRKLYPIICRQLVDIIHSAYLRALHGGERESLRESRSVQQSENLGGGVNVNVGQPTRTRSIFNPKRYLVGKNY